MKSSFYKYKLLYGAVFAKKKRLFLSVLGIVIGVASFVVMVSVGNGTKRKVLKEFRTFGSDTVVVVAGKATVRGGRPVQLEITTTLKLPDAKVLKRLFGVKTVAPVYDNSVIAEYRKNTTDTQLVGTTPEFFKIRRFSLVYGRFFTGEESLSNAKVAVIGWKIKRELFPTENPIGKTIKIRKLPFKIIGVLEKIGTDASGRDQDDQIIVPISSAMNRLFNVDYIKSIFVQVESETLLDIVCKEIDEVLRKRHMIFGNRERDYSILKAEEILKYKRRSTMIFSALIASISIISLIVGSFGVMAVMMLSVKERTKEIGIRKAIGATKKDILLNFLLESSIITSFGGFFGIVLGSVFSFIIARIAHYPFIFSVKLSLIAFFISVIFGVFAGVYPAKKASDVDPAEILSG